MAEPFRSRWLDWEPPDATAESGASPGSDPAKPDRTNSLVVLSGNAGPIRRGASDSRTVVPSPIAQLDAAWARAAEAAQAGFDEHRTTPDEDTLEAATWLLLDTDPDAPEGERSFHRQQAAETIELALGEIYRGVATATRAADGSISVRSAPR